MRPVLPLAALALLWVGPAAAPATTFEEAQKAAARAEKPILVDFFATW